MNSLKNGYLSLIWQIPLAVFCFTWSWFEEQKYAVAMAWLNSFACIEINKNNLKENKHVQTK